MGQGPLGFAVLGDVVERHDDHVRSITTLHLRDADRHPHDSPPGSNYSHLHRMCGVEQSGGVEVHLRGVIRVHKVGQRTADHGLPISGHQMQEGVAHVQNLAGARNNDRGGGAESERQLGEWPRVAFRRVHRHLLTSG